MPIPAFNVAVVQLAERYNLYSHAIYLRVDRITKFVPGPRPLPEAALMEALATIEADLRIGKAYFTEWDYCSRPL